MCTNETTYYPTPSTVGLNGGSNSRNAAKKRGMYPTPQARDHMAACVFPKKPENQFHLNDTVKRMFVCESLSNTDLPGREEQRKRIADESTDSCAQLYCANFEGGGMNSSKIDSTAFSPTVRTRGLCGGSGAGERINQLAKDGRINEDERKAMRANGGQLNPDWVEWLMGWPIGWTDLDKENEQLDWLRLEFDPADLPEEDERFIPRITSRKQYRIPRITALGNGQVPLCAAIAFDIGLGLFNINDNSTEKETK